MNQQNKVSSQFVQDTIPQSIIQAIKEIPSHYAKTIASQQVKIVQQEVEIARLKKLIATMEIRN